MSEADQGRHNSQRFWQRRPFIDAALGGLISGAIIIYAYTYASNRDPAITNFVYFLFQKQYRLLMFTVSLFPIGIGYFYGRLKEEIFESRQSAELLRRLMVADQRIKTVGPAPKDEPASTLDILLSPREIQIIKLVAKGLSNKEIAAQLYLSELTVKTHLRNIFKKLEITDRTSAAIIALRDGLFE